MSNSSHDQKWHGTERELNTMTDDLDQMHHDVALPAMRAGVDKMIEGMRERLSSTSASRRGFILGASAGVAGGAAALLVPSMAGATQRVSASSQASAEVFPPKGLKGDLAVAAVAASLENLGVFAYTAGLNAAAAGKLGSVPAAVATFATTARAQHADHAAAWNSVLRTHGNAKVSVVTPSLAPTVKKDFAKVTDVTGLAKLALTIESIAAETYQFHVSHLSSKAAIELAASIEPVEMQHIAILYYVLGMYPGVQTTSGSPLAFSSTAEAVR